MSVHAPIQVRRVVSSFTATPNDFMLLVDASSGAVTGTLYRITKGGLRDLYIIQTGDNSNLVTLKDVAGNTITTFSGQDAAVSLQLDDFGDWHVFGSASIPLPQDLEEDASPEFAGLTLGGEPVCATYIKRLAAQFNTTTQSAINITGLSVSVKAGGVYSFRAVLYVTNNASTNTVFAIGGTSTATSFTAQASGIDNDASAVAGARITSRGSAFTLPFALDCVVIEGLVVVNAAGTLTVQCALAGSPESGQLSVLVNSSFEVKRA